MKEKYISIQELEKLLWVKRHTIYNWRKSGALNYYKLGKVVRFNLEEVEVFIKQIGENQAA